MQIEQWRAPVVLRVKSVIMAAVGVTIAAVFFPLWFGVPVAVICGAWGLGMAALGASVAVDGHAGVVALRMGLITRRIRLADITAVLVDQDKVSIGRVRGGEVSVYAWRKDRLDALLGVPVVASDVGHAIASAVALAQAPGDVVPGDVVPGDAVPGDAVPGEAEQASSAGPARAGRTPARTRSGLATALLGGAGAVAIAGALLVRVHWDSPVLTVLGVVIALALGVSGLLYLLVALWILLTGQAPRTTLGS